MLAYLHFIKAFIRNSFQGEMAFRFNFLVDFLRTFIRLGVSLGGIFIIFSQVETLNGWEFSEVLALLGIYFFIQSLKDLVIGPSLESLAGMDGDLWFGRFDFTLLKPVPTQFYVSFRNWRPWALIDMSVSIAIIVTAALKMNAFLSLADVIFLIFSIMVAITILYSVLLILISCAFWYLGTPLIWIYDSLIQTGRYPIKIYPGFLRFILTWIIPVGFIITVPAEVLLTRVNLYELLGGCVLAIILFAASSLFFKGSLKKYSSASS
jgi:ABC-2 type transport system permease protein